MLREDRKVLDWSSHDGGTEQNSMSFITDAPILVDNHRNSINTSGESK